MNQMIKKEELKKIHEPIKDIDKKRPELSQTIVEIVEVLSKHKISIGNLDLIFDSVKNIVLRETKIQITKDILDKKY